MKKKGKVTQTVHIPLSLSLTLPPFFIVMKQIYKSQHSLLFFKERK